MEASLQVEVKAIAHSVTNLVALAVQQKMMRHSDIGTTMNIYGTVVTDEMAQASAKVAGLAFANVIN